MINKSINITDFHVGTVRNQETKFLPTGSTPLQSSTKASSKKIGNEVLSIIRKELGG
jgi:hypothetical protein